MTKRKEVEAILRRFPARWNTFYFSLVKMPSVSLVLLFWLTVVGGIVMKKHVPGRTRDDSDGATSQTVNRAGSSAAEKLISRDATTSVMTPSRTTASVKDVLEKHGHLNKTIFSDKLRLIHLVSLDNIQQDFTQNVFKACISAGSCTLDSQLGRLFGDLRNHSVPLEIAASTLYNHLISYQAPVATPQAAKANVVHNSPVLRVTTTTEVGGRASEALLTIASVAEQTNSDLRVLVLVKTHDDLLQAAAAHMFNLRSEAGMTSMAEERGYLEELSQLASHLARLDHRFFRCYRTKTFNSLSPTASQDLQTFLYPSSLLKSSPGLSVRDIVGSQGSSGAVSVHPSTTKLSEAARNKIAAVAKKLDGVCQ